MDKTKSEHINIMVAFSTFLVIVTGVALIGYYVFGNEPEEIQGQVDCREYNVSSKIQGRIARLYVEEGDYIHVGDTLAVLDAPEVDAQQRAAQATEGAAQAISEMTDNGSRKEQISTAAELLRQAQAARTIAYKSYQRVKNLYDAGVASAQKCDDARAAFDAATAQVGAARSQYEMAVNGSRREEKRAAADQARAAKSGVDVVRSLLKETVQVSAVEGEVDKIYAHTGELVGNGSPIMTVNLLDDVWGKFNIREDHLEGIRQGSIITAYSPAFKKEYRLKVYYMKGEDEYATWKSTKADKDYDLKTFEIRARPVERNKELRPGMLLIKK